MRRRSAGARFVRRPTALGDEAHWLRVRLLNAIADLSRERAVDSVTVRSICARAGVGRHTFFQTFASLDEALTAALPQCRSAG